MLYHKICSSWPSGQFYIETREYLGKEFETNLH